MRSWMARQIDGLGPQLDTLGNTLQTLARDVAVLRDRSDRAGADATPPRVG